MTNEGSQSSEAAAGWYSDPNMPQLQERWWGGNAWTEQVRPKNAPSSMVGSVPALEGAAPKNRMAFRSRTIAFVALALDLLVLIAAVLTSVLAQSIALVAFWLAVPPLAILAIIFGSIGIYRSSTLGARRVAIVGLIGGIVAPLAPLVIGFLARVLSQ